MKSIRSLALPSLAMVIFLLPASLSAQIINIDFLGRRFSEPSASPNYSGQGAAGGGTTFNGLIANDLGTNPSDNITVSGTDLVTAADGVSTVGFTISGVGADNQSGTTSIFSPTNNGYLFLQAGNNKATSASFTISGLGSATEEDLFFYTSNTPAFTTVTFTLSGGTQATFAPTGIYTTANTIEFEDVPVVDGSITGTWQLAAGDKNPAALSGLTIESVPEPSVWAMMGLGAGLLLWRLRRQNSAI